MLPPPRPLQPIESIKAILSANRLTIIGLFPAYDERAHIVLLGIRGYYADLGAPGNDRNIYDDAMFIVSPSVYAAFNANTDPSLFRPGIASLKAGVWLYKKGKHPLHPKPGKTNYDALRQAAPVTVIRDGGKEETGLFGINIHRGGRNSTGSEGCQTIYPDQWDAFIETAYAEMTRCQQAVVPYVLTVL